MRNALRGTFHGVPASLHLDPVLAPGHARGVEEEQAFHRLVRQDFAEVGVRMSDRW